MASVFALACWLPLLSGSMRDSRGLRALGKALVIFWSVLLGGTLLRCLQWQLPFVFFAEGVLLGEWLLSLMSGLMVVWWRTRFLVPPLLVLVVLHIAAVIFEQIVGGAIWMRMLVKMLLLVPVGVFVLFLVHCSLFKGLSSGVLSLLLQANDGVHLDVDNLWCRARLLDHKGTSRPAELVKDGDLILHIDRMICLRRLDTVRKSGGCLGGSLMVGAIIRGSVLVGARLLSACTGFFIAIVRAVVSHDGVDGTALDPMVWSVGGAPWRRRVVHAVRDRAFLRGPAGSWDEKWSVVAATRVTGHDIEFWPYSVIMLVKWVTFLCSLHWPLGVGRILELVVSFKLSCSFL